MTKKLADDWVRVPQWERYTWLRHGFSTRRGGVSQVYGPRELNLGQTAEDDPGTVAQNRLRATQQVGGKAFRLATLRQVHGVQVLAVTEAGHAGDADALLTATPGVLLGVMAADCVPVLVADVRRRLVGAFHAGWRGTVAGMAGEGVAQMVRLGAHPGDLIAAVGPSIGPCCYQVGKEVRDAFRQAQDGNAGLFQGKAQDRLDLWESNRRQLVAAGVPADRVSVLGECTACSRWPDDGTRKYFSHRAETGRTGRMMALIGIAGDSV